MRIVIYETEHFEVAYPLIRIFDLPGNQVTIFTSPSCYKQLAYSLGEEVHKYTWRIGEVPSGRFLYRMYRYIKKENVNLVILASVSSRFNLFSLLVRALKGCRIVLTLHDINTHFQFPKGASLRSWVRGIGKRSLVKQVDNFNVIAMTMLGYLRKNLPAGKKVFCLPGAIYEPEKSKTKNYDGRVQLVIPGAIDNKRRDYNIAFELLDEARRLDLPIFITFLGAPVGNYGREIIERAEAYTPVYDNLRYFNNPVDQPLFDSLCSEADFILMPTVIETVISDGIAETYGVSKSSGNMFDVVRYAKPFFAPTALQVDPYLDPVCMRFSNVQDIMRELSLYHTQPQTRKTLEEKVLKAVRQYTVEKVRARNRELFE